MLLQSLDIIVGFAVVMLAVSLIITTITQLISGLLGLRGTNLRWGLKVLLAQAGLPDPATTADRVLGHPLVSDSTFSKFISRIFNRWRLASAIRSQELTGILELLSKKYGDDDLSKPAVTKFINDWFEPVMDRVAQRFAMSMRFWTVGTAIVVAFVLQLDSIALFRQLSDDREVRTKLVASADAILQQSERIMGRTAASNVYAAALQELKTKEPSAARVLTNAPVDMDHTTANFWLRAQLRDVPQANKLISTYNEIVSSNIVARTPELMGDMRTVTDLLAGAGIRLVPDYRRWSWDSFRRGFIGMLISAALLSLGAPFWFNGLKTLMNLRPVLATRVEKEKEKEIEKEKPSN
jgi:hypothetical protein